jgi:hypothetical protein
MADLSMPRRAQSRRTGGSASAAGRPWTQAAIVGLAAHVFLELAAGVGIPGASLVGPGPAAVAWVGGTRVVWRIARRTAAPGDQALNVYNGLALTAVVAHYVAWPRKRTRIGVPWLTECEGLRGDVMPAYNLILLGSGGAALIALVRENRSASGALGLAPLLLVPLFVRVQHGEYDRLAKIAEQRPAWWNRRLTALQSPPVAP